MSGEFDPSPVTFTYVNWREEVATRRVLPIKIWYGTTEHHPEPQWFLRAYCLDREADRDFALMNVNDWEPLL